MNEINFKSIEEINCILTSDEFKKGMEEVEKRNKELLESTKVDYEAMNQRFTV